MGGEPSICSTWSATQVQGSCDGCSVEVEATAKKSSGISVGVGSGHKPPFSRYMLEAVDCRVREEPKPPKLASVKPL